MKQATHSSMQTATVPTLAFLLSAAAIFGAWGCGGQLQEGVGITNVSQAAPKLPEYDPETGDYRPYYATAEMNRPRYFHEGVFVRTGVVYVLCGSDERGLSSLDTLEFFDQAAVKEDTIRPETITGAWFDTNFEGDPMTLENGPRMFFTVNELADGTLLVVGGTNDIDSSQRVYEKSEVFNPDTRISETISEEMLNARFRHTTTQLFNGNLLITGGQIVNTVTIINENIEPGQVGRQEQRTVFESVATFEIFSVTEQKFLPLRRDNSSRDVTLNTPRGRAGHDVTRMSGFDLTLGSADDILLIAGGFQTLTGQAAPQTKLYGAVGREEADGLTVVEFLDPVTQIVTQAGNVSLRGPRVDTPHIMNLGRFNDLTIDGVPGMGNVMLLTHGNSDGTCPDSTQNMNDELYVATFSGFGPAQGLQFTDVDDPQTLSQNQGTEGAPGALPGAFLVGRCQTNPVSLPRHLATAAEVPDVATWIFAIAGTHVLAAPGCPFISAAPISSGCVFDPFFDLRGAAVLGLNPRDLQSNRTLSNPTGVIGTWLTLDGSLPTTNLDNFATTPSPRWALMKAAWRVYPANLAIPGADGIIGTFDDRILLSGGGSDGNFRGGEAAAPSAEVLLPPGVNETAPSP